MNETKNFNQFILMDGAYAEINNDNVTIIPNPKKSKKTIALSKSWSSTVTFFPFYKIYYVIEGEAKCFLKDRVIEMKKNNLYFIPSFQVVGSECKNFMSHYYIHFKANTIDNILEKYHITECVTSSNAEILIKDLIDALKNPTLESPLKISSILNYLVLLFVDTNIIMHKKKKLYSVVSHIERNITKKFTIEELAKSVNMSPNYFSTLFKKTYNMSPSIYITKKKIEIATDMLLENKLNITEISNFLNFDNPLYFSNRFKKYMGISPLQWKKANLITI